MSQATPSNFASHINLFQPSVAFHVETNYLICNVNQMTGFYMEGKSGLNGLNEIW